MAAISYVLQVSKRLKNTISDTSLHSTTIQIFRFATKKYNNNKLTSKVCIIGKLSWVLGSKKT
jgi:hypothetical protein